MKALSCGVHVDDSMWCRVLASWKRLRHSLIVLCIFMFLPIIQLNRKPPRLLRSDVTTQLTSSTLLPVMSSSPDANCVVTATSPAHRGHVVAVKRISGRLGNDMFVYASLVGIAARNKMVPIYKCDALARTFHVTGTGNNVTRPPSTNLVEESAFRCFFHFMVISSVCSATYADF